MASNPASDLPDIRHYPWQRRRDYLMLVAAVAVIDQHLHPDELELMNRWMNQFALPPKSRAAVEAILALQPLDRRPLEKRLGKTDLAYSLMLDLMGMAMADGVLMDKEIHLLRGISRNLNIDPIDFNIMIEFIHSVHQASQLSSPEPLFEHNIISAFQLLRDRKVHLFPHTLLCVASADYDRRLKERWRRFLAENSHD